MAASAFHGWTGRVEELEEDELSDWIPSVTVVRGNAEEAIAHQVAVGGCGHATASVRAAVVEFTSAYPALLRIFGGDAAYGGVSEARGRLALWRLLRVLAGSTDPVDVGGFVARIRCVTWQDPCDEIWYLHLAIEDPDCGMTWVLDGQDFD
ncbi:hypothetical protein JMUB6875_37160 [Nocardia sp. JMUB6875]|uniref:hypothetical protein n=1 Tax=Nocardia sp. JMUB6875 TaxID=3158170 RepID=UPI0032E5A5BF